MSTNHHRSILLRGLTRSGMEMVRDDEAASSTQRTITARDMDRRWRWHIVVPVMMAALPLTVLEISWAYRHLGRPGTSSAHQMMPSLV
jgi:hypothetical protein